MRLLSWPRYRGAIVLLALVITATTALPAAAHRVGRCTVDTTADRCERWGVIYNDSTHAPPRRGDEFATAVATNDRSVFSVVRSVGFDVNSPYSSTGDWLVLAHDLDTGAPQWEARRRSRHYDNPLAIAVSPNGRQLYVTGSSYDDYSIVATDAQMVTVAYDAATGQELWSRIWDGRPDATDVGKTITVTPNGRTVIVGGVTTTAERDLDYVTVAYDAAKGREMWAKTATGLRPGGSDVLNGIAMSPRGDLVYVTGESAGVEQYDADYLTIAYDVRNGRVAWQQRFAGIDEGGSDRGRSVAVSPDGSQVYVTGDSYGGRRDGTTQYDYATVAYDARSGAQRWVARYGGPMAGFNYPVAVAASADRVVVTGQSRGATAEDVRDYGTVAYDTATGDEVWRQRYAPPNSDEIALDLAMSPDGTAVFVTGSSTPAVRYTALSEAATVAYRTDDGRALWTSRLDVGAGNAALGRRLAATPDGGVALVGQTTYSADPLKPQSQNIYDALIVRY